MSEHSLSPNWRAQPLGRRGFLRVSAASAATVAIVATTGCSTSTPTPVIPPDPHLITLVAGDQGLLSFAYLLAVAQATLYQKVIDSPASDLSVAERAIFTDMRDHEVVHRQVLRYAINPDLTLALLPTDFAFNLASFNLGTRAGVLAAAQQLEDLVVAVYPLLLPLFTNGTQRALFLKTSSVHARHAATVRDLLTPGSFANDDVVENAGQLAGQVRTKTPTEVLVALAPYFAPYVITAPNAPLAV